MQLSRLLVSYPGHEGAIAPSARDRAAVRQTDHGCCDAGFSRAAHGSRDATGAVSGLKAIWPRRRRLLRRATREQRDRTRFAGRRTSAILACLETANDPEGAHVPRRGHTSFQWDRAPLLMRADAPATAP